MLMVVRTDRVGIKKFISSKLCILFIILSMNADVDLVCRCPEPPSPCPPTTSKKLPSDYCQRSSSSQSTIIIIYLIERIVAKNCQVVVAYIDEIPYRMYKQEGYHDIDESHGFRDRSDVKYSLEVYNNETKLVISDQKSKYRLCRANNFKLYSYIVSDRLEICQCQAPHHDTVTCSAGVLINIVLIS